MDDPYAVLGLDRHAGKAEVKKAYRALAKLWHPDRHRGDPVARERFIEINLAYQSLGGMRETAGSRASARPPATRRPETRRPEAPEPSDDEMMERIFGVTPHRKTIDDAPGLDVTADRGPAPSEPEPQERARSFTKGRSMLTALNALFARRRRRLKGPKQNAAAARPAQALKASVSVPLATILGGGTVEAALPDGRRVLADIPRATGDGTVLVLPPESSGTDMPVELTVTYQPSDAFRCAGTDLHASLAIDLETAVLGGQATLATLDGPIRLTVPAWSGSDRTLRVGGRGLPRPEGGRGDLLVHLRVLLPESTDPRIVDLMKQRKEGLYV